MYRKKMSYKKSRKNFSKYSKTKTKNYRATPMRGGFRI